MAAADHREALGGDGTNRDRAPSGFILDPRAQPRGTCEEAAQCRRQHQAQYRHAMVEQGKCLIRIEAQQWGPIATGGFPPRLAD